MNISLRDLLVGAIFATSLGSAGAVVTPEVRGNWADHAAFESGGFVHTVQGDFIDIFKFSLLGSDLLAVAVANNFENLFNIANGNVSLFRDINNVGDYADDGLALDSFPLTSSTTTHLFTAASSAGEYYYSVTGNVNGLGGGSYLLSSAIVPEPSTYALLLAGLGVMGFVAKRRRLV